MRAIINLGLVLCMVASATILPANAQSTPARDAAKSLIQQGLAVKAEQTMTAAIRAGQKDAEDYAVLGDASRYAADYKTAIQAYTYALQIAPMNTEALSGLALAYAQAGKTDKGMEIVRTGLSQTTDLQARRNLVTTLNVIRGMNSTAVATTAHIAG